MKKINNIDFNDVKRSFSKQTKYEFISFKDLTEVNIIKNGFDLEKVNSLLDVNSYGKSLAKNFALNDNHFKYLDIFENNIKNTGDVYLINNIGVKIENIRKLTESYKEILNKEWIKK